MYAYLVSCEKFDYNVARGMSNIIFWHRKTMSLELSISVNDVVTLELKHLEKIGNMQEIEKSLEPKWYLCQGGLR